MSRNVSLLTTAGVIILVPNDGSQNHGYVSLTAALFLGQDGERGERPHKARVGLLLTSLLIFIALT